MSDVHINYQEYLESYAWKALKKTKLEEQLQCECCRAPATSAHHLSYERLGREKPEDIVSICERCHEECHHVGGYQIKNDEEILRRRFEEVKKIYLGESEMEFTYSGEYYSSSEHFYLNGEKLEKLLDLKIVIFNNERRDSDENETIRLLLRSKKYIYCLQSYSYGESDSGSYGNNEDEGYSSTPENDGSWHPAYEGIGVYDDEDKSIRDENIRNQLIGMTTVWANITGSAQCQNAEYLKRISIDLNSFEIIHINSDYEDIRFIYFKDKNNVYYNFCIVKGADPKTFEVIDKQYSKDKRYMYYLGGIMKDSDSSTFEILNYKYSKDKNYAYYKRDNKPFKIEGSNGLSFEILEESDYVKDKNYVYYEHDNKISKLEGADPKSFEILREGYSKDKNYVYYNGSKLEGSDGLTFEFLNEQYMKDKNNVYCKNSNDSKVFKIEGADPKSFEILEKNGYAKDKNYVYFNGYIQDGLDGKTFIIVNKWYIKDKDNVYFLNIGNKVKGVDSSTFESIDGLYAKDKDNIYYDAKRIEGMKPDDYKIIGDYNEYIANINDVYYRGKKVKGADPSSFSGFKESSGYAKDKNFVYHDENKIEGANPENFYEVLENMRKEYEDDCNKK